MSPQSETPARSAKTPVEHAEELYDTLHTYIGCGGKISYANAGGVRGDSGLHNITAQIVPFFLIKRLPGGYNVGSIFLLTS